MSPVVRKRPWYLVVALLGALFIGAAGALQGWQTFMNYRVAIDPSEAASGIADDADRAAVVARLQSYLQVLDAAKPRAWPLGVAALLLGTAIFFFATRVFAGSRTARNLLVQLVLVQAGVNVADYLLLRDVVEAELQFNEAEVIARLPPDPAGRADATHLLGFQRTAYPIALGLDSLCSVLIVVALTRRRARDFLEAKPEVAREP